MSKEDFPKIYLYKRIVDAKLYIDRYYLNEICIASIASEACLSKFHFLRLFKQMYGITPHKYVTRLRIEKAKSLLEGGASISETCHSLGFKSLSSFNKLFRQHLKDNPSAYSITARALIKKMADTPLNCIPQCFVMYMGWDK
jgi:AraC-like DNA-binding protein